MIIPSIHIFLCISVVFYFITTQCWCQSGQKYEKPVYTGF
ncbi:MAG: SEC-C domain-containing protein [Lachnospiraceae bacterium]|nr:SEC-C domain-containing protein [Lachnospiraceae bacterium]